MGRRHRWLPERMAAAARRGWNGLTAQTDSRGSIRGTCIGTRGGANERLLESTPLAKVMLADPEHWQYAPPGSGSHRAAGT